MKYCRIFIIFWMQMIWKKFIWIMYFARAWQVGYLGSILIQHKGKEDVMYQGWSMVFASAMQWTSSQVDHYVMMCIWKLFICKQKIAISFVWGRSYIIKHLFHVRNVDALPNVDDHCPCPYSSCKVS